MTELLNTTQLANLFGVTVPTAQRWGRTGRVPGAVRVGRRFRFRSDEILEWIEAGCPPLQEEADGSLVEVG